MLGQPHDRGLGARLEVGERLELAVLGLLELRVDRPPVRAAVGVAELLVDAVDHLVAEGSAQFVSMDVRLGGRVAHEIGQQPLDDPVLADDAARPIGPGGREDRLLVPAALDEPFGLEPLQHLPGRGTRDVEHLGHARGDRLAAARHRLVLPDREREEVDRLQVLVDSVPG